MAGAASDTASANPAVGAVVVLAGVRVTPWLAMIAIGEVRTHRARRALALAARVSCTTTGSWSAWSASAWSASA